MDPLERAVLHSLEAVDSDPEPFHSDDASMSSNESAEEAQLPMESSAVASTRRFQTGPKGVLADYSEHQRLMAARKAADQQRLMNKLQSKSLSTTTFLQDQQRRDHEDADGMEDELTALDDAKAMALYRQQRIQEIMDTRRQQQRQQPQFGTVKQVHVHQYVDAIEKEHPSVRVLVHLYEPDHTESQWLHTCWPVLARRYGYAKFIAIRASEADPDFDPIALPAVLVYRGGDLIVNLIRLTDQMEMNREWDVNDVERVLLSTGALLAEDQWDMNAAEVYEEEDDDDNDDV